MTNKSYECLAAAERAALSAGETHEAHRPRLLELAMKHGVHDASHFTRRCRQLTGFPPRELVRRILEDESFWPYRAYYGAYDHR